MSFKEYVNSVRGKSEPVSTPRSSFADYVNNIKFQQAQEKAQKEAEDLWKYATDYTLESNALGKIGVPGARKYVVNFNPIALEGTKDAPEGTRFATQAQLDAINAARKEITDYYATQVVPEKADFVRETYKPKYKIDLTSFMPKVPSRQTVDKATNLPKSKWDLPADGERIIDKKDFRDKYENRTLHINDKDFWLKLFEADMPHTVYNYDGQTFHNNIALKNYVESQRIVEAQDFITHQTDFNELANKFANLKADSSFGNTNEIAIHNVINGYKEVGQTSAFYKYKFLDDTQKGVYNYLAAKSKDAAQKYLEDIDGTLEDRKAEAIAENLDEYGFLGDVARGGLLAGANLQQGFTDVAMAGTMLPNSKADPRMREAAFKTTNAERLSNAILEGEDSALAKLGFDVISTASRQALPLIAGAISGSAGYTAIMGAQVTAQSMKEAAQSNKPIESGFVYGVMQTGLEVGLERLFGGIAAKVGGGTSNKFVSKMMSKIDDKVTNKLLSEYLKYGVSFIETASGESVQELSQALIDPMVRNIVYNENNTYSIETLKDAFYQAFIGFLAGGVMGVPSVKASVTNTQFERIGENSNAKTVLELCEETGFTSSEDYVAVKRAVESGKQVDPLTLGRLSVEATQNVYNPERFTVEYLKAVANLGTVNEIAELMYDGDGKKAQALKELFATQEFANIELPNVILGTADNYTQVERARKAQPIYNGKGISNLSAANGEKDAVTKSVEKVTGHMELTADQKELRRIGSQFGARVEFADLDHYVTDENGNKVFVSPEGNYDPDTNTITLNTNAKENHKPLEYILKHEMTHSLENNELYKQFSNAVISSQAFKDYVTSKVNPNTGKNYTSRAEWAQNIIDLYDRSGHPLGETDAQKQEGAMREQIANFVGDMLFGGRGDIATNLLNAMENKPRNAFIAWVKQVLSDIKRRLTGNAVTEIERIEREFLKVAYAVSDQNAQQQNVSERNQKATVNEKTTTDEGDGKKTTTETTPVVKENVEKVNVEIDEKTESASPLSYSLASWEQSDYVDNRNTAAKELADALGISQKKAKDYIDSINSIAKVIADDRTRLDYVAAKGRSTFVSNAEYGGSVDCSTLCPKRKILTGTFSAVQKALKNSALTAEEILDIRNRMKEKGLEVSCGLCYVEGSRAQMGKFSKEFIERYKKTNPEYVPDMFDVNTPEGVEQLRIDHPEAYEAYEKFWNNKGVLNEGDSVLFASQQKPKLYQTRTDYKGEILNKFKSEGNVVEKNKNGGLRLQSFSDFEIVHLIDMMQVVMDMSRVGLAGQAYTKVPDFALALGNTGLKINLSLIAKGVDADGNLIFDDVEGMPIDTAMRIRDMYSDNVGTILVVFNDAQLKAALADNRVDFIIPFHRSQWKKALYEKLGLPKGTKDYTYQQNEKYIKPVYYTTRNGTLGKRKATNYMPNDYWKFGKSGKENAEDYLKMCAKENKRPKFYKLLVDNKDGSYSLQPDGSTDGYWKLLIDFKMYNNDGVGVPQQPVKPDFNMEESLRMLEEYKGGHQQFPVDQETVDEFVKDYKAKHKMDDFVENEATEAKAPDNPYSNFSYSLPETDRAYLDAVEKGDMETAQRMVDEAAKEAGYVPVSRYHQTGVRFTKFSNEHPDAGLNDSDTPNGYFFKENDHDIGVGADFVKTGHGGSIQMRVYLKHNNLLYFKNREDARTWYSNNIPGYRDLLKKYDAHLSDFEKFNSENNEKMFKELIALEESGQSTTEKDLAIMDKYDKIMDEWIDNRQEYETSLRAGMRKLLNEYFIENDSGYDGIELADDGHRYIDMRREDVHTFIVFKNTQIKSADPVTYDDNGNVIPLSQRFNTENEDIRYSLPESVDFDSLIDAVSRGEISAEEAKRLSKSNKLLNPIEIANTPKSEASTTPKLDEPKMQGEGDGESKLHGSLDRSAIITDEVKEKIKADTYIKNYGTTTNKETLAKAMQRLDEGGAKEVYWWEKTLKPDEANAVNVAEGLILLQRYQDAGDTYGAIAVAEKLREIASASGQTVQIFSVIGRFTPEMMVAYSQHELDKAFEIMQEGISFIDFCKSHKKRAYHKGVMIRDKIRRYVFSLIHIVFLFA